jgi:DNA replication protein DnaC
MPAEDFAEADAPAAMGEILDSNRRRFQPKVVRTTDSGTLADRGYSRAAEFFRIVEKLEESGSSRDAAWRTAQAKHPGLYVQARGEMKRMRETEQANRQRDHFERIDWPKQAGRFSGCRLETFAEHGTEPERATQRRVIGSLDDLDLEATIRDGQNILFIGPCGTGKDHLMHALAWRVFVELAGDVTIRNGSELRRELKSASMREGEEPLIRRLVKSRLLCLSDPVPSGGAELTGFQADALYHVVNARWDAGRPIWGTINLPLEETRDAAERILTTPVWDRLKDGALIVRCNWRSYRRHADVIE